MAKGKGKKGNAQKRKAASSQKANPFDVRNNKRLRHEVVGRRVKGAYRNQSAANKRASEARTGQGALLDQYKQRSKNFGNGVAGAFIDRRFGERREGVSEADKSLARRIKVAQRRLKKDARYNLSSQKVDVLTHAGRTLGDDDFERMAAAARRQAAYMADEGEDDRAAELLAAANFGGDSAAGGGDGSGEGKRTHKEIMQEVIMKSKLFKAERQKEARELELQRERLDAGFDELHDLLSFGETKSKGKKKEEGKQEGLSEAEKAIALLREHAKGKGKGKGKKEKGNEKDDRAAATATSRGALGPSQQREFDDFDTLSRSLRFEARGQVSLPLLSLLTPLLISCPSSLVSHLSSLISHLSSLVSRLSSLASRLSPLASRLSPLPSRLSPLPSPPSHRPPTG